jgi:hypothetical protein
VTTQGEENFQKPFDRFDILLRGNSNIITERCFVYSFADDMTFDKYLKDKD